MTDILDGFCALSEEERYYRHLFLSGRSSAEYIRLPHQVEASARLEEKIVLSSSYYSRDDDKSVIVLKHPNYMPLYLHSHRFAEICYVVQGRVSENIEGRKLELGKGSLIVILPGFYHSIGVFDDETIAVNIIISRDFFAELDRRFSLGLLDCSFAVFNGLDISSDISMLFDRQGRADDISSLEMEVIAEAVMLKLRRCERHTAEMCSSKRNEVYRIMSYIEENLRDVTLSSLASHFNLSEQYASRMVKERTGQLFSAIVRKLRMEEACRLLMNDKLSIKEIAYLVGYTSQEQFSRTFRLCYQMSPREYRLSV